MTNKLIVVINSLNVPKIKKILLYEMKFLAPNYSCLQDPWLGGYSPRSPFSLSSVLNWICCTPPPEQNSRVRRCWGGGCEHTRRRWSENNRRELFFLTPVNHNPRRSTGCLLGRTGLCTFWRPTGSLVQSLWRCLHFHNIIMEIQFLPLAWAYSYLGSGDRKSVVYSDLKWKYV